MAGVIAEGLLKFPGDGSFGTVQPRPLVSRTAPARGGSLRSLTRREAMTRIATLALVTALLLAGLLSAGCP